jgi:hypothetical protein
LALVVKGLVLVGRLEKHPSHGERYRGNIQYIQLFASLSSETVFFIGREAISISDGPVEKVERVTCILD